MDNIIIINGFPNTEKRKDTIKEQIESFKKTNIPILLIKGCEVGDEIAKSFDYLIINKEIVKLDKSFS